MEKGWDAIKIRVGLTLVLDNERCTDLSPLLNKGKKKGRKIE